MTLCSWQVLSTLKTRQTRERLKLFSGVKVWFTPELPHLGLWRYACGEVEVQKIGLHFSSFKHFAHLFGHYSIYWHICVQQKVSQKINSYLTVMGKCHFLQKLFISGSRLNFSIPGCNSHMSASADKALFFISCQSSSVTVIVKMIVNMIFISAKIVRYFQIISKSDHC